MGVAESNHRTMCKFESHDGQRYRPIWIAITKLAQSALAGDLKDQKEGNRSDDQSAQLPPTAQTRWQILGAIEEGNVVPEVPTHYS